MSRDGETDMGRLLVAAHEVGHLLGFRTAGLRVASVSIRGRGARVNGVTDVPDSDLELALQDPDRGRSVLVAMLAGEATGYVAGDHWGWKRTGGCDYDYRAFHSYRRKYPALRALSAGVIRAEARRLVRRNWSWIERKAYVLAERGRL